MCQRPLITRIHDHVVLHMFCLFQELGRSDNTIGVSYGQVLEVAAKSDKPVYLLSKKEIEELIYPKSGK